MSYDDKVSVPAARKGETWTSAIPFAADIEVDVRIVTPGGSIISFTARPGSDFTIVGGDDAVNLRVDLFVDRVEKVERRRLS
jgi:hypothetical protein